MVYLNMKFHKAKGNSKVIQEVNLQGGVLPIQFAEGQEFELDNPKLKGTIGRVRTIFDAYNRRWQIIVSVYDCGEAKDEQQEGV